MRYVSRIRASTPRVTISLIAELSSLGNSGLAEGIAKALGSFESFLSLAAWRISVNSLDVMGAVAVVESA